MRRHSKAFKTISPSIMLYRFKECLSRKRCGQASSNYFLYRGVAKSLAELDFGKNRLHFSRAIIHDDDTQEGEMFKTGGRSGVRDHLPRPWRSRCCGSGPLPLRGWAVASLACRHLAQTCAPLHRSCSWPTVRQCSPSMRVLPALRASPWRLSWIGRGIRRRWPSWIRLPIPGCAGDQPSLGDGGGHHEHRQPAGGDS